MTEENTPQTYCSGDCSRPVEQDGSRFCDRCADREVAKGRSPRFVDYPVPDPRAFKT